MPAKPAKPTEPTTAQLVEELRNIEDQLEPYRPAIDREDKLRSLIRERFDASPADESVEAPGLTCSAILGPKAIVKTIDNKKLFRRIGAASFQTIAKISMAAIERMQAGDRTLSRHIDLTGIVSEARTGARSLRIFRRAAGEKAA